MKNRLNIKTAILVLAIAFMAQGFNNPQVREFLSDKYNRTFSNEIVLSPNEKEYTQISETYLNFISAEKNLAYVKKISIKSYKPNYEITYLNPNTLNESRRLKIKIQDQSDISFASSEKVYYRNLLDFYEYNIKTEEFAKINPEGVTIFKFHVLDDETAIFIGNVVDATTNKNSYGFFTYNLSTREVIKNIKELDPSAEFEPLENSLKYAGKFVNTGGKISYVYDMYGKVLLFETNGDLFKEITTIDGVKAPGITNYMDMYTYKRGSTFYSNSASLLHDDHIYIFSCRPNNTEHIIVDKYEVHSGQYVESFKLKYRNNKSNDINFIYQNGADEFVLGFSNFFKGFDAKFDHCEE